MPDTMPTPDQPSALASTASPSAGPVEPTAPLTDFDEWLGELLGDLVDRAVSGA